MAGQLLDPLVPGCWGWFLNWFLVAPTVGYLQLPTDLRHFLVPSATSHETLHLEEPLHCLTKRACLGEPAAPAHSRSLVNSMITSESLAASCLRTGFSSRFLGWAYWCPGATEITSRSWSTQIQAANWNLCRSVAIGIMAIYNRRVGMALDHAREMLRKFMNLSSVQPYSHKQRYGNTMKIQHWANRLLLSRHITFGFLCIPCSEWIDCGSFQNTS